MSIQIQNKEVYQWRGRYLDSIHDLIDVLQSLSLEQSGRVEACFNEVHFYADPRETKKEILQRWEQGWIQNIEKNKQKKEEERKQKALTWWKGEHEEQTFETPIKFIEWVKDALTLEGQEEIQIEVLLSKMRGSGGMFPWKIKVEKPK